MSRITYAAVSLALLTSTVVQAQDGGPSSSVPADGPLFASAHVTGDVEARFNFTYIPDEGVSVQLFGMSGFTDISQYSYPYHIHTNRVSETETGPARCAEALGHLDPLNVTENFACSRNLAEYCQVGDLSGKHGGINPYASGSPPNRNYTDPYLRFFPQPFSLLGRSVVIHNAAGDRIACGNIISTLDGTADASGQSTGQDSTYQNAYEEAAPPRARTTVYIGQGGMYGSQVDSAAAQSASLTIPAAVQPVSAADNIVLSTAAGGALMAVAAGADYVQGQALPTQAVEGASSMSAARSTTGAQTSGVGAAAKAAETGAAFALKPTALAVSVLAIASGLLASWLL